MVYKTGHMRKDATSAYLLIECKIVDNFLKWGYGICSDIEVRWDGSRFCYCNNLVVTLDGKKKICNRMHIIKFSVQSSLSGWSKILLTFLFTNITPLLLSPLHPIFFALWKTTCFWKLHLAILLSVIRLVSTKMFYLLRPFCHLKRKTVHYSYLRKVDLH